MTDVMLEDRAAIAVQAVRAGGQAALRYFREREQLAVEKKGLQDLVSIADREVELIIRRHLESAFPGEGILGEEGGGGLASRLWVIDPIDGTANFLRGMPYWAVVLAYAIDGDPALGLTYDPVHDELFVAQRGKGATRNGTPIRVSDRSSTNEACLGLSYSFKTDPTAYHQLVADLLALDLDHRRMGSSALSLAHVADGRLDGLACLSCSSWDVLAGLLLVQEAGGFATRYVDGASLLERRGVAAAAPGIRDAVERITGERLEGAATRAA